MYKPSGYTSVSPYLLVDDPQVTLDFIKAVFGNEPLAVYRKDGGIMHAEVRIDDTVLMIGGKPGGAMAAYVHAYVADVDTAFAKAIQAGGTVIQQPVRKDDSDKRGGVQDPSGVTWWLATHQGSSDT